MEVVEEGGVEVVEEGGVEVVEVVEEGGVEDWRSVIIRIIGIIAPHCWLYLDPAARLFVLFMIRNKLDRQNYQ